MDTQKPIFKSLAMIEERIREKLTVETLAESLHFSRYHYQRLFQEAVGESVMRYVTRRRISLAAVELADSKRSVLEIALRYGYDSHEGFTRSFKAHMGVTPAEYRKYHFSISTPKTEKERRAMLYSKTTDEIIRELNNLIVQMKETAEFTGKVMEKERGAADFYGQFLKLLADRTQELAGELSRTLESITDMARCPDRISARFMIIRAIEDVAFWSSIIDFQAKLTIARARGEHQAALMSVCDRYETLAGNARVKSEKIAGFFNELSSLIFQDMRENAGKRLQNAIRAGEDAGKRLLEDPDLPYAWIGDEVLAIARELSSVPLEKVTVGLLEDCLLRADIITFAADVDVLRKPSHKPLFEGISKFEAELKEAYSFFQGLSEDIFGEETEPEKDPVPERTVDKRFSDLAFQGNILLFYLKGEVRKLGSYLKESQGVALKAACDRMDEAVSLARRAENREDAEKIMEILKGVYEKTEETAGELGDYGAPTRLIGEEIGRMTRAMERAGL